MRPPITSSAATTPKFNSVRLGVQVSAGAVILSRLTQAERNAVAAYAGAFKNIEDLKDAGAGSGGSGDDSLIPAPTAVVKEEVSAGAVIISRQGEEQRDGRVTGDASLTAAGDLQDAGAVSVGSGDTNQIPAPAAVAKEKGRVVSAARRAMDEDQDPMSESALLDIFQLVANSKNQ